MYYKQAVKTRSPLERRFLEDCVTVGLIVKANYLVDKIHADFAIPEKRMAIEIDSKEWHSSQTSYADDTKRDKIYANNGWNVIRIHGRAVMKGGETIAKWIKEGRFDGDSYVFINDFDKVYNAELFEG